MVILTQIWISDNHPNMHDPEPTTPSHSPVVSDPTPLLETGSPAPKTWRELISGDQVLQDIYFQGRVRSGLGMEADTSPSGLAKKDTFSGPKFIHSESIPSRPESDCQEKKKKKKPRQQVECGGGKEAGREDRQAGAREGQRGTGEEGNLEGRGEGWRGEEGGRKNR